MGRWNVGRMVANNFGHRVKGTAGTKKWFNGAVVRLWVLKRDAVVLDERAQQMPLSCECGAWPALPPSWPSYQTLGYKKWMWCTARSYSWKWAIEPPQHWNPSVALVLKAKKLFEGITGSVISIGLTGQTGCHARLFYTPPRCDN